MGEISKKLGLRIKELREKQGIHAVKISGNSKHGSLKSF